MKILSYKMALVLLLWIVPAQALSGEIAIIVNSENPVENLNMIEIRKYLLKEKISWPNGSKVRSVDRKGLPPERKAFLNEVAHMSPENLDKYWVSKRYEKGIPVPPRLSGDLQIIEYVQAFEGAISYVNADKVKGTSGVKVVGTVPMP